MSKNIIKFSLLFEQSYECCFFYEKLQPWSVCFEKLKLLDLCGEVEQEFGRRVFWKMLQIDVFDPKADSHDAIDVFYQWLTS